MPKLADDPATKAAQEEYAREKKVSDHSRAEFARLSKGRPTPTQEELDLANLGAHFIEHDPDGSDPDPNNFSSVSNKSMEASSGNKPAQYQTRHATPHKAE
jgi:hypothetical protein